MLKVYFDWGSVLSLGRHRFLSGCLCLKLVGENTEHADTAIQPGNGPLQRAFRIVTDLLVVGNHPLDHLDVVLVDHLCESGGHFAEPVCTVAKLFIHRGCGLFVFTELGQTGFHLLNHLLRGAVFFNKERHNFHRLI